MSGIGSDVLTPLKEGEAYNQVDWLPGTHKPTGLY